MHVKSLRGALLVSLLIGGLLTWFWLRRLEESYDPPYTLVENGLYIGRAVKQPPPGTQAVVNLCGYADVYQVNASLWEPVLEDENEPNLVWLRRVVDFISQQRREGKTTYVHCQAGVNRSAAVVTAYLMREHGWSRDDALAYLQNRRPIVQPNPALMRLLSEWERDHER